MAETLASLEETAETEKQRAAEKAEEVEHLKARVSELEAELEKRESALEDAQSALKSQKDVNAQLSAQVQQSASTTAAMADSTKVVEEGLQKAQVCNKINVGDWYSTYPTLLPATLGAESRACYPDNTADRQPQWAFTYCYLSQPTANHNEMSTHCHCWGSIM
jgi:chromosome segregation ATPase